jgi:hypothetical protein
LRCFYIGFKYLAAWMLPFIIAIIVATILQKPIKLVRITADQPKVVAPVLDAPPILNRCHAGRIAGKQAHYRRHRLCFGPAAWFQQAAPTVVDAINSAHGRCAQQGGLPSGSP